MNQLKPNGTLKPPVISATVLPDASRPRGARARQEKSTGHWSNDPDDDPREALRAW